MDLEAAEEVLRRGAPADARRGRRRAVGKGLAAALAAVALVLLGLAPPGAARHRTGHVQPPRRPAAASVVARPPVILDMIPFGTARRGETADYSLRHYGQHTWRLTDPKVIVLHFTAGGTYASAYWTFRADTPNKGELPGVSSHFVIDKDGTIYQLVPLGLRARHCIGLNHVSISIEFVQETGAGARWADRRILGRTRQVNAGLRLVRSLIATYGIERRNVIGHSMANGSPYFKDLRGWRNTHVDWQAADVREFRSRL